MNVKWDVPLREGQLDNPVLYAENNIQGVNFEFNEDDVLSVLTVKGHQLKTWGGSESTSEPHWIGVKKSTPLHTDPRYPRYTHHLIVHVDDFGLRGINKESTKLETNQFLILDTHSPHQLHANNKGAIYYIAASIDSHTILDKEITKKKLIEFVNNNLITNNTERIIK